MHVSRNLGIAVLLLASLALVGALAFLTRNTWREWFDASGDARGDAADAKGHAHAALDRLKLSRQARDNLKLAVKPLKLETYWRTVQVPGVVVERRGKGDQTFAAPVAGVVKSIAAYPGDIVEPGGALLTLTLTSESLQMSQTELYKNAQEITIVKDQKKRFEGVGEAVSPFKVVELQYQLDRLEAARRAYRADLAVKGLRPDQVDKVEKGEFLKEIVVRVPDVAAGAPAKAGDAGKPQDKALLEVEELKVFPGEQVQAGHVLGFLSNHQDLNIEGRGFREDTPLLEKAAAEGWAIEVTFPEEKGAAWPALDKPFTILYLANNIDPVSQTFPFYIPLPNHYHEYSRKEKRYRIWRFRPGQRTQLGVPVQEFKDVFVLPATAVAREGADVYVFRQNGDFFERKPVHILFEDERSVAVANDGSIFENNHVAHDGAEALNRAWKAQEAGASGHAHDHAGHSH